MNGGQVLAFGKSAGLHLRHLVAHGHFLQLAVIKRVSINSLDGIGNRVGIALLALRIAIDGTHLLVVQHTVHNGEAYVVLSNRDGFQQRQRVEGGILNLRNSSRNRNAGHMRRRKEGVLSDFLYRLASQRIRDDYLGTLAAVADNPRILAGTVEHIAELRRFLIVVSSPAAGRQQKAGAYQQECQYDVAQFLHFRLSPFM